jgi:hypothetical protein
MHGLHRMDGDVTEGDSVRWTAINEEWDTPGRDAMVHRVNKVREYGKEPYDAWIACRPVYRAFVGSESAQLAVTDEPVDCMACIAARCEP